MQLPLTLPTPYGPAGYRVIIAPDGRVTDVQLATNGLPEAVFRLTFGDRWEEAREYFSRLAENVPFQVELALHRPPASGPLAKIGEAANELDLPDLGGELPPFDAGEPEHVRRLRLLATNAAFHHAVYLTPDRVTQALDRLTNPPRKTDAGVRPYFASLEPWLLSLTGLLTGRELVAAWVALGYLRTPTARDRIFQELERPGRHIVADALLRGLAPYKEEGDKERFRALYPGLRGHADLSERFLKLLAGKKGPASMTLALEILGDHPRAAALVLKVLRVNNHPDAVGALRAQFDREEDYFVLDYLAGIINDNQPGRHAVGPAEMNAKLATEHFTDGAPVTWPQMLEPNWTKLVLAAPAEEIFTIVEDYLARKEPRLQRNALLQLKTWAKAQTIAPALTPEIERRLREAINSRYDKISTVALDVVAETMPRLECPLEMTKVLLAHLLTSRYRLMDAAALKKAAADPELKAFQVQHLEKEIAATTDPGKLDAIEKTLPYLRFLGVREDLKKQIAHQRLPVPD